MQSDDNSIELLKVFNQKRVQNDLDFLFGNAIVAHKLSESSISYNVRMLGLRQNGMLVYYTKATDSLRNCAIDQMNGVPKHGIYVSQAKTSKEKVGQQIEITVKFLQSQLFYFDDDPNGLLKYPKSNKQMTWVFRVNQEMIMRPKKSTISRNLRSEQSQVEQPIVARQSPIKLNQMELKKQQFQAQQQSRKEEQQREQIEQEIREKEELRRNQEKQQAHLDKQKSMLKIKQELHSSFEFRYQAIQEQICLAQGNLDTQLKEEIKLYHLLGEFREYCMQTCKELIDQHKLQYKEYRTEYITLLMDVEYSNYEILADILLQLRLINGNQLTMPLCCQIKYNKYKCVCIANYPKLGQVRMTPKLKRDIIDLTQILHLTAMPIQIKYYSLDKSVFQQISKKLDDNSYQIVTELIYLENVNELFPVLTDEPMQSRRLRREIVMEHCPVAMNPMGMISEYDQDVVLANQMLINEIIPRLVLDMHQFIVMPIDSPGLVKIMHQYGINMKYLGIIALQSQLMHVRQLCIIDMIGRSLKCHYRYNDIKMILLVNMVFSDMNTIRNLVIDKFDYDIGVDPNVPLGGLLSSIMYHCQCTFNVDDNTKKIKQIEQLQVTSKIYQFNSTQIRRIAQKESKQSATLQFSIGQAMKDKMSCILMMKIIEQEPIKQLITKQATKLLEQHQNNVECIYILYYLLEQFKDLMYFNQLLKLIVFQLGEYHPLNATVYQLVADQHIQLKQYDDAIILMKSSLSCLMKCLGIRHYHIGYVLIQLSSIYLKQSNNTMAIQSLLEAQHHYSNPADLNQIWIDLCVLYFETQNYTQCMEYLNKINSDVDNINLTQCLIGSQIQEITLQDMLYNDKLYHLLLKQDYKFEHISQVIRTQVKCQLNKQDNHIKRYLLKLFECIKPTIPLINKDDDIMQWIIQLSQQYDGLSKMIQSMIFTFLAYEPQIYYDSQIYYDFEYKIAVINNADLSTFVQLFTGLIIINEFIILQSIK